MRHSSSSTQQRPPKKRPANRRIEKQASSSTRKGNWLSRLWLANPYIFIAAGFAVLWLIILGQAFHVQIVLGHIYKSMADDQHTYTQVVEGMRGTIYDRKGQVLARSVSCQSVYANPRVMTDINDAANRLAPILKMNASSLASIFKKNRAFIWLKRKIDDATAAAIQNEHIPGIGLRREYERVYPYKTLAGQLLGFVGLEGRGLEGLEKTFDEKLRGDKIKSRVSRSIIEQVLNSENKANDPHGEDITLTIDVQVQYIAEEVLRQAVIASGAKWGGVLVSEVESGEILAWAQYPFFNPNNYSTATAATYRNRLAGDSLEPGSTFKPILMAAALEENIVTPETSIYCEKGIWRTKYASIRDDTHSFGNLTATEIIAHSSNIGSAKIGLKLGSKKFHAYLSSLGFGKKTGIGIHETRGIMRKVKDWSELDLMSTSFGQSISVTGVQMLQAYTTIAGGGVFKPVKLVLNDLQQPAEQKGMRIFSKKTSRQVIDMMEEVVDGNGTGSKARIPGVKVAGKTGTAQKAARSGRGYSEKRLASFGGMVPADSPRYVIYVMLDEPTTTGYGGAIAAPVFQKVAMRTLAYNGYLPDVTFASEGSQNQAPQKKLTPAQLRQKKKDEIYLKNLEAYRNKQKKKLDQTNKGNEKNQAQLDTASQLMPDLCGLSLRKSMEACARHGLVPSVKGSGAIVIRQQPAKGAKLPKNGACTVWLSDQLPRKNAE